MIKKKLKKIFLKECGFAPEKIKEMNRTAKKKAKAAKAAAKAEKAAAKKADEEYTARGFIQESAQKAAKSMVKDLVIRKAKDTVKKKTRSKLQSH